MTKTEMTKHQCPMTKKKVRPWLLLVIGHWDLVIPFQKDTFKALVRFLTIQNKADKRRFSMLFKEVDRCL